MIAIEISFYIILLAFLWGLILLLLAIGFLKQSQLMRGYQPKPSPQPEGQNPPGGGSNVSPPPHSE